jgi:hypothetical protein
VIRLGHGVDDTVPDTVNDQPNADDTPDANDAARRAALERLTARVFDQDLLARVDKDGSGLEPDASAQSRPDTDAAPAADQEERSHALQQEARELAGDPADRAEIAELRSDLDDPLG